MHRACILVCAAALIAGCAAPRPGADDTWAHRASDFLGPVVPSALRFGPKGPALKVTARAEPDEFRVAERREVKVLFTVQNTTGKAERLDFPTAQRVDMAVRAPDGKRIFLWSEDRLFPQVPAIVVINPGERIEYEAAIPTRDMVAGRDYAVEAGLVGRPDASATIILHPR